MPEPQPYPLYGVAQFALVTTVETALLWFIIRPRSYRHSWGRSLTAALLFLPVTLYFGSALMHAPWYQYMHFLWSVLLSVALAIAFVGSATASARRGDGT